MATKRPEIRRWVDAGQAREVENAMYHLFTVLFETKLVSQDSFDYAMCCKTDLFKVDEEAP
jgi:hypothetical protein